ncbi:hypothetical protein LLS1_01390 [Leifsonia sp. LS1]|uniref:hypothetical protein n=1 Tax=Leifsonia sp. LS1 TaxID=2828483 RepID=UPI001CFCF4AA|nr:hypothetical protein [Leifsonia sp. LS1]GIT78470.1 hypothetical protein LLS1_01390 [Leifsonia sp. LS1]
MTPAQTITLNQIGHDPSRRGAPSTPNRGIEEIRGKVLFAAGEDAYAVAAHLRGSGTGIVLTGSEAAGQLRRLRATYPKMPLIADPKVYQDYTATLERPFAMPDADDQLSGLPAASLAEIAQAQLDQGATLAVLPMGYLAPGDAGPLRSAVAEANELSLRDVMLVVPADWSWLRGSHLKQFIAIVRQSTHPVAVALNNKGNALDDAACLHGYRSLFEQVPNAIAWRTDHNGLGAVAHGAAAAVIGFRASLRHISVEGDFSRSPENKHPQVFVPDLMMWGKSDFLRATYFTTVPAAGCTCGGCKGAAPDRFRDTPADILAGNLHNVDAFLADSRAMLTDPAGAREWWRQRILTAVQAMERFKLEAQRPRLKPRADIENWFNELV